MPRKRTGIVDLIDRFAFLVQEIRKSGDALLISSGTKDDKLNHPPRPRRAEPRPSAHLATRSSLFATRPSPRTAAPKHQRRQPVELPVGPQLIPQHSQLVTPPSVPSAPHSLRAKDIRVHPCNPWLIPPPESLTHKIPHSQHNLRYPPPDSPRDSPHACPAAAYVVYFLGWLCFSSMPWFFACVPASLRARVRPCLPRHQRPDNN